MATFKQLEKIILASARWKPGLSIRGRRQLICTVPDCYNPAGPRDKTHGLCWQCWWGNL